MRRDLSIYGKHSLHSLEPRPRRRFQVTVQTPFRLILATQKQTTLCILLHTHLQKSGGAPR